MKKSLYHFMTKLTFFLEKKSPLKIFIKVTKAKQIGTQPDTHKNRQRGCLGNSETLSFK